jgi:gliding motility-associated-like protein
MKNQDKFIQYALICHLGFCGNIIAQTPINYGDCITGSLSPVGNVDNYSVATAPGDWVLARLVPASGSAIEPILEAFGPLPGFEKLASGVFGDVRLLFPAPPNGGLVTLVISDYSGDDSGDYFLFVNNLSNPFNAINSICSVTETIPLNCYANQQIYQVGLEAGTFVRFSATSTGSAVEPCFDVYGPNFNSIATDCFDVAQVDINIPETGCYRLVLYDYSGDDTGQFAVTITALVGACATGNICSGNTTLEICNNNLDDDNDSFIDCEDPSCAPPFISNVATQNPGCQGINNNGSITINAVGSNLQYSIDAGQSWWVNPVFQNLTPGSYQALVRNNVTGCRDTFPNLVELILETNCPEICNNAIDDDNDGFSDCNDADCKPVIAGVLPENPVTPPDYADGQITINATGQNLEYSINSGVNYQSGNVFTGLPAGNYIIRVRNSVTGCFTEFNQTVSLFEGAAPCVAPAFAWNNAPASACIGSELTLCVENASFNFNYTLLKNGTPSGQSLSGGGVELCFPAFIFEGTSNYNVFATLKSNPTCYFTMTEIKIKEGELGIEVSTKDESAFNNDGEIHFCMPGGEPPFTMDWEPDRGMASDSLQVLCLDNSLEITGLRAGFYSITITDAENCSGDTTVLVNNPNRPRIGFPEKPLLTPNGDGMNDKLVFEGLYLYPERSELTVFNRYGSIIYQANPYSADDENVLWDGTWNGEPAPADTYFYTLRVFEEGDQQTVYHGFITLVR